MKITLALAGNQNCGKTTIFNTLTKSNRRVGNFPGVTVESGTSQLYFNSDIEIVDLPGTNSLFPYTAEEELACDFILSKKADVIINVVDASNLERNLYFTLQLIKLKIPMVMALSMTDELENQNKKLDAQALSKLLRLPVVCVCAPKQIGLHTLIDTALNTFESKRIPNQINFHYPNELNDAVSKVFALLPDLKNDFFTAESVFSSNEFIKKKLVLKFSTQKEIFEISRNFKKQTNTQVDIALAYNAYTCAEKICQKCIVSQQKVINQNSADKILTNRLFAFPIFCLIMFSIFSITFGKVGSVLSDTFMLFINTVFAKADNILHFFAVSENVCSFVSGGILTGIASVLSFLPQILILFFLLSILENCGYMARIAFIFDKMFKKLGLSGRSATSFLLGFGCSVPAVMSCKTLFKKSDRSISILLVSFMSCSAKLPVYTLFAHTFFPGYETLLICGLYLLGIVWAVVWALILKTSVFKDETDGFILEFPKYRIPTLKSAFLNTYTHAKNFISRTFTVIFLSSVIIWILQNLNLNFHTVENISQSILFRISNLISPIFAPLGFGNAYAVSALISGIFAKETIVSTLAVTASDGIGIKNALLFIFNSNKSGALSFLTFVLLYMPCVATQCVMQREMPESKHVMRFLAVQNLFAYICSFIVYKTAGIIFP